MSEKNDRVSVPELFQLTSDSLLNNSASTADSATTNDAAPKRGGKIKRETTRSRVTKKSTTKTATTSKQRRAKTENLKKAVKNQIEENDKENESKHDDKHVAQAAKSGTSKKRVKTTTDRDESSEVARPHQAEAIAVVALAPPLSEITPIAAAPSTTKGGAKTAQNKRLNKILNENDDVLVNVRCDNKNKYSKFTSTPSGLRRRPLKAPQDVSIIDKGDN